VLTAKIEDDCAPFDPLGVAAPDLRPSLKDRRVGGLGIHFVRNLMSEVSYARVGARNRLVLRRTLTDMGEAGSDGSA
jgi:serine/threonine-protein kinase RsbW